MRNPVRAVAGRVKRRIWPPPPPVEPPPPVPGIGLREVVYSSTHSATIDDLRLEDADRDPAFVEAFVKARNFSMVSKAGLYNVYLACQYVSRNRVPGAWVECGVWRGGSSILAALTFEQLADPREVWLYDTFEGMPEPTAADVDLLGVSGAEYIERFGDDGKWIAASEEDVLRNAAEAAVAVRTVKGRVEETIPATVPAQIAVLRLDTDWYESTRHELEHLWSRLEPGGVMIIDDYGAWLGSGQATDEFFADKPEIFLHRMDDAARLVVKPR